MKHEAITVPSADHRARRIFRDLMAERRRYQPGDPDHAWRTRACRKLVWLMRGVPSRQWSAS